MKTRIFENARFCPKGDIEANWNKAVGFVPLDKEIIIYKADEEYPVARFKIGDGQTVVQDLPFAGADMAAIEKLINEKGDLLIEYVDNAIKIPQPDYEQKDSAAADYIKNRPFYEDKIITAKELVNDSISEEYYEWIIADINFSEKDVFDITLNGVEYSELTCRMSGNDAYYYGNLAVAEMGDDTGEPFIFICGIFQGASTCAILTTIDVSGGVPIIITRRSVDINFKQLDEKFIPDTIARVDYVEQAIAGINMPEQIQADYAQNDVNASDYIKNRPFYEETTGKQHTYIPTGTNIRGGGYVYQLLTTEQIEWPEDTKINYEDWSWGPVNGDESNIQFQPISSNSVLWKDFPDLLIWRAFDPRDPYITGWYTRAAKLSNVSGEHVTSVTVDSFKGTIKQLDEKFIPDSIARTSDIVANNIENGSKEGSIQQIADGVADGFSFTGKNPNATNLDSTLTGTLSYGAVGNYASAFGGKSSAQGKRSHAEGITTIAKANYSHAEGDNSVTLGADSHAEGYATVTGPNAQAGHAEGINTQALGKASHAEGQDTIAYGQDSHTEGSNTATVLKDEQGNVIAIGEAAHAEGGYTKSIGKYSHTEGYMSQASAEATHAEGKNTIATEIGAHAEGNSTEASGPYAHAEGDDTHATSSDAHAEGKSTTAKGNHSHAEGDTTIAEGTSSHAGGTGAHAKGSYSFAHGNMVVAGYANQFVVGQFNSNKEGTLFEVGNGADPSHRDNAFEVYKNGEVYAGGVRLLKEGEGINSALFSDLTANHIPFWDGEKFKSLEGLKTYSDGKQVYIEETKGKKLALQDNQLYLEDTITNTANPMKAHLSALGGLALSNSAKRVIYGYDYIGVDTSTGPTFNDYDWQNRKTFRWPTKSGTLALAEDNPERSGWQLLKSVKNKRPSGASYYYTADYYQNISSSTKQMIVLDITVNSPETLSANPISAVVMSLGRWNSSAISLHGILADTGWGKTLADFPLLSAESASWIVVKGTGTGMNSFQFNDSGFVVPQMYDAISGSNPQATLWGMGVQFSSINANSSLTVKGQRYKVVLLNTL